MESIVFSKEMSGAAGGAAKKSSSKSVATKKLIINVSFCIKRLISY